MMTRFLAVLIASIACSLAYAQGRSDQERVAIAYEQAGDWRNAARLWQEMLAQQPTNPRYLVGALRSLKMLGQAEAMAQLFESTSAQARSWEATAYYGYALWKIGKQQQATDAWARALEQLPSQQETFYRTIASLQLDAGARQEAARTFQRGRRSLAQPGVFAEDLVQLAIAARQPDEALDELVLFFRTTQNLARTQGFIAAILAIEGTGDLVRQRLERVVNESNSSPLVLRLYEWTLRQLGDYRAALDAVIRLERLTGQTGRELYAFAERARTEGALDVALDAYSALQSPSVPQDVRTMALFGYAQTIEQRMLSTHVRSQKDLEQLIGQYEKIASNYPSHPLAATALLRIAQLQRDYSNDCRAALARFDQLIERYPSSEQAARGLIERVPLLVERYGLDSATTLFERDLPRITAYPSLRLQAAFLRGELDFYRCRFERALSFYREAASNLDDPIANDAIERLTLLSVNREDSLALCQYAHVERSFFQRDLERGFHLTDSLANIHNDIAELALLHAASIALERGADSTSLRYWTMLSTQYPETLYGDRILWGLAEIARRQGKVQEALSLYNQLLAQYPNSILVPQARQRVRALRNQM